MKKRVLIGITLVLGVVALGLTGCAAGLTSDTIVGQWFCQLGQDGGLLENEYTIDLNADGTYKFTEIYMALGIQDLNNSGYTTGTYTFDGTTLTLDDGTNQYSFELTPLAYPKSRVDWKDLDGMLPTIPGVSEGSDGVFEFDKQS